MQRELALLATGWSDIRYIPSAYYLWGSTQPATLKTVVTTEIEPFF